VVLHSFLLRLLLPLRSTLFPYTTLFRSVGDSTGAGVVAGDFYAAVVGINNDGIGGAGVAKPARRNLLVAHGDAEQPGGRNNAKRSEEHTSELQSRFDIVCRLLLEKKKKK